MHENRAVCVLGGIARKPFSSVILFAIKSRHISFTFVPSVWKQNQNEQALQNSLRNSDIAIECPEIAYVCCLRSFAQASAVVLPSSITMPYAIPMHERYAPDVLIMQMSLDEVRFMEKSKWQCVPTWSQQKWQKEYILRGVRELEPPELDISLLPSQAWLQSNQWLEESYWQFKFAVDAIIDVTEDPEVALNHYS